MENKCLNCPNHDEITNRIDCHEDRLNNHGERIRVTEITIAEMKTTQIGTQQAITDLKLTIAEMRAENRQMLDGFLTAIRKSMEQTLHTSNAIITSHAETKNKIKLKDRKEIWLLAGLIISALIKYFVK